MDHLPPRPDMQSTNVLQAFAKAIFPAVATWRVKTAAAPLSDDDILSDLREALTLQADGFIRACYLREERGWAPDQDLVLLLSNTAVMHTSVCRAKQAEWAMLHGVRLQAKEGDTVSFKKPGDEAFYTGKALAVFEGEARAVVSVTLRGAVAISPPVLEEVNAEQVTHVKNGDTAASRVESIRDFVGFQMQQQLQAPVQNAVAFA